MHKTNGQAGRARAQALSGQLVAPDPYSCHVHGCPIELISCLNRKRVGRARVQVLSGQLVAPSVPTSAETMEMQRLVDTYGKTFHTWQARKGAQGMQLKHSFERFCKTAQSLDAAPGCWSGRCSS